MTALLEGLAATWAVPTAALLLGTAVTAALGAGAAWLLARIRHQRAAEALRLRAATLEQQLETERRAAGEQLAVLEQAEKTLRDTFQAAASEALQRNNQSFLDLAKASLSEHSRAAGADLDARRVAIDELVQRLDTTPLLEMAEEDWAEFFLDMAIVARREGLLALQPLLDVLMRTEETGVLIDEKLLKKLSAEFAEKMIAVESKVHDLAGHPFNLGSPKQLQQVLEAFDYSEKIGLPVIVRMVTRLCHSRANVHLHKGQAEPAIPASSAPRAKGTGFPSRPASSSWARRKMIPTRRTTIRTCTTKTKGPRTRCGWTPTTSPAIR